MMRTADSSADVGTQIENQQLLRYHMLMKDYVNVWELSEKSRRSWEEENASNYQLREYRSLSAAELEEVELKHYFPDYSEDYLGVGLAEEEHKEDTPKVRTSSMQRTSGKENGLITTEVMWELFQVYENIFWSTSATTDLESVFQTEITQTQEAIQPFLHDPTAMSGADLDKIAVPFHLVCLATRILELKNVAIAANRSKNQTQPPQQYNIYKDSNLAESRLIIQPLHEIRKYVSSLLDKWPEHPLLVQIDAIIARLFSFHATSPLMKFLTGLELLLGKLQEWETYTSKELSVQNFLTTVGALVTRWRKLELSCWSQILQMKEHEVETAELKFWFHLYEVIFGPNAEGLFQPQTFVALLTKFLEDSTLGSFNIRLRMLGSFWKHIVLIHGKSNSCADESERIVDSFELQRAGHILKNMYTLYSQFSAARAELLKMKKEPLVKQLDDFLKLAKWDDVNYYSIKQNADAAHRKLKKMADKYQV